MVEAAIEPIVTIEHSVSGAGMPEWLFSHHLDLAQSKQDESGDSMRIMVIHPNLHSRDEAVRRLNNSSTPPLPIDSSLHMTIDRLIDQLHTDLRLPVVIDDDTVLFEIIHRRCAERAASAGFPRLHTNLDAPWARGRTRLLDELHRALVERELPDSWEEDPGLLEYEMVLRLVEDDLSMTHPRLRMNRIIKLLAKVQHSEDIFCLRDVHGLVMLDHDPTLSHSRLELLLSISRIRPLHQLCNPGSFRLGEHGAFLLDIPPCSTSEDLPVWLPTHEPLSSGVRASAVVHHLGLQRPQHCGEAVFSLLEGLLAADGDVPHDLLIIDPDSGRRSEEWRRLLEPLGLRLPGHRTNHGGGRGVHWLKELACLGQGPRAWSLSTLRSLLTQSSLPLHSSWLRSGIHPSQPTRAPIGDAELLESLARGYHIQGGMGSLRDWLHALSQQRFETVMGNEEDIRRTGEQTQWWLLCLATRMRPLLNWEDRRALDDERLFMGCDSGHPLPMPDAPASGDEWLEMLVGNIDWDRWMNSVTEGQSAVTGVQRLLHAHARLRGLQRTCSIAFSPGEHEWVEEFSELIRGSRSDGPRGADAALRLLTPAEALGCTADVVIITHLAVDDWPLSVPVLPWLDAEDTVRAGLLDPDSPLRSARHSLEHCLGAASTVFLLDPTRDHETQPCTPFAEWLDGRSAAGTGSTPPASLREGAWRDCGPEDDIISTFIPDELVLIDARPTTMVNGSTPRSMRQRDGLARERGEPVFRPLLNPRSTLRWREGPLLLDRMRREPAGIGLSSDYQPWGSQTQHVSSTRLKLIPSALPKGAVSPRYAPEWPVMGRQHNRNRSTPSIDPRPLEWERTGIAALDSASGHLDQPQGDESQIWSVSRLKAWMQCPRMGWLDKRLRATAPEVLAQDLDQRTRGITLHNSIGELICSRLGFQIGEERDDFSVTNLAACGSDADELMSELLQIVSISSSWLKRSDAMAVQRRRDFCGMNLEEYNRWWEEGTPALPPRARLGALLLSEIALDDSVPLVFEYGLGYSEGIPSAPIEIAHPSGSGEVLRLRGWIDRVDMVRFEDGTWIDEDGDESTAPLSASEDWRPRRLIIIRDMKTVDGPRPADAERRHLQALFEDSQLALYSRAWELTHPGDLVIAAGISQIGTLTSHRIEADPRYSEHLSTLSAGDVTTHTHTVFRNPGEPHPALSNPYRAWIRWRLLSAFKTDRVAREGAVHPTPGRQCGYCNVKEICELAHLGGDQR